MPNQAGTAGPGTSSSTRRSGSGWRSATTSRRRSSRTPRARRTATRNIFDGTDPRRPDYIGNHPGTAFLELQFYPPGWAPWPPGVSCDATKWCAAMAIFSLNQDQNTGVSEQHRLPEHGRASSRRTSRSSPERRAARAARAARPDRRRRSRPNPATDLFMNSGDQLDGRHPRRSGRPGRGSSTT